MWLNKKNGSIYRVMSVPGSRNTYSKLAAVSNICQQHSHLPAHGVLDTSPDDSVLNKKDALKNAREIHSEDRSSDGMIDGVRTEVLVLDADETRAVDIKS
uniref:Uncharacterized protein n=1 Tax=Timema poppense TaxID=170557 RepID=A0A7R9DQB6_TIMPO|nr:unnamed protein product [Timema poppensis]